MKCPFCDGEMTTGYVQCRDAVYFTTKPHKVSFRPYQDDITLTSTNWTQPTCDAWCCPACRKVILAYSDPSEHT